MFVRVTRAGIATSVAAVALSGLVGVSGSADAEQHEPRRLAPGSMAADTEPVARARRRATTLVGAGDLCGRCGRTAERVRAVDPDVVVTIGDNAYSSGLLSEFRKKYGGGTDPQTRWGRPSIKNITLPGYGNHDCYDYPRSTGATKKGCAGAVAYFGPDSDFGKDIPGTPGSYYKVVARGWLLVHLNSAGDEGSGTATDAEVTAQRKALKNVLAADGHRCEVVIWHHPRYSSGSQGNFRFIAPWFRTAARHGVDVVLSAHDRGYERFAPMNTRGRRVRNGTRQFVVGTGGAKPHAYSRKARNSRARVATRGIIKMRLTRRGYSWAFLDQAGSVRDSGSGRCHS
jgi:hypothetical protein